MGEAVLAGVLGTLPAPRRSMAHPPANFPPMPAAAPSRPLPCPQQCPDLPIILYISGSGALLERMAACGPDIISLCNTVDMAEGIERCGRQFAYQASARAAGRQAGVAVGRHGGRGRKRACGGSGGRGAAGCRIGRGAKLGAHVDASAGGRKRLLPPLRLRC